MYNYDPDFKNISLGAGEMAQGLRVCAEFAQDPSSLPMLVGTCIAPCNSSSVASDALLCHSGAPDITCTSQHRDTEYTHRKNKYLQIFILYINNWMILQLITVYL